MRAELIAVGTELLLGQIVNTNARFLAEELAALGIDAYYQTVVGDNAVRIKEALHIARSRADLIMMTGGLGPTLDDLTRDVLAEDLGRKLEIHEPTLAKIRDFYAKRGLPMAESNVRQALLPEGAEPLPNDEGMAVGSAITVNNVHYVLLPGPPREMEPMFERYVKPWLTQRLPEYKPLFSVMLKFAGIGESSLEHELIDLIGNQQDPSIAPYAKDGEVAIRLTTRAESPEEAARKMRNVQEEIRRRVGAYLYASRDIPLEQAVIDLLGGRGQTFAAAESCTGGLISHLVTGIPGSSAVFRGSVVCYTNLVKSKVLQVPLEILQGEHSPGAVSSETAELLARNVMQEMEADYGLSVTGVAGPGSSEGKPVGLVYIGVATRSGGVSSCRLQWTGSRSAIQRRAAKHALYRLWQTAGGQTATNPL